MKTETISLPDTLAPVFVRRLAEDEGCHVVAAKSRKDGLIGTTSNAANFVLASRKQAGAKTVSRNGLTMQSAG